MTVGVAPAAESFLGAAGNRLVGDVYGAGTRVALLLHGGGQTRHAFAGAAERLARAGWRAVALDQRGHGESEWVVDGAYGFRHFAADAAAVAAALKKRFGAPPAVIGASLGGIAALLAEGEAAGAGRPPCFSALVLVDITPRINRDGASKVIGFMGERAREGFGSIEEAAGIVAAYLPHRPRPQSNEGLRKNLRLHPDGRWRWHWDPRFVEGRDTERDACEGVRVEAAKSLRIPALLVRGASSELVDEEYAREFLALAPHAKMVDVAGARHMVAGDRNDVFSRAIVRFLAEVLPETEKANP